MRPLKITTEHIDQLKLLADWLKVGMSVESFDLNERGWFVWLADDQTDVLFAGMQIERESIDSWTDGKKKHSHDVLTVQMPFGEVMWCRH